MDLVIKDANYTIDQEKDFIYSEKNTAFATSVNILWYANKNLITYKENESYSPFSEYFSYDSIEYSWGICVNKKAYYSSDSSAGINKFNIDKYGSLSFGLNARTGSQEKLNYMVFLEVNFIDKDKNIILSIKAKKLKISGSETGVTYSEDGSYISCTGINYYADSSYTGSSCFLPNTSILMSDGTTKLVENLKVGDEILSFNHETGEFEESKIIINEHANEETSNHNVLTIIFNDGTTFDIAERHGFYSKNENQYIFIDPSNYKEYIGDSILYVDTENNLSTKFKKIKDIQLSSRLTKVYAPVSANNLNVIAEGLLSVPAAIPGLINIFEFDENTFTYNQASMKKDIEIYGLLDYSYFKDYMPYEVYEVLPCKYLAISIGKGLITWDEIYEYAKRWGSQLVA